MGEGEGEGEGESEGQGGGGVGGTVGLKSSLTALAVLDLLILDHMFFKLGVNSNLVPR